MLNNDLSARVKEIINSVSELNETITRRRNLGLSVLYEVAERGQLTEELHKLIPLLPYDYYRIVIYGWLVRHERRIAETPEEPFEIAIYVRVPYGYNAPSFQLIHEIIEALGFKIVRIGSETRVGVEQISKDEAIASGKLIDVFQLDEVLMSAVSQINFIHRNYSRERKSGWKKKHATKRRQERLKEYYT